MRLLTLLLLLGLPSAARAACDAPPDAARLALLVDDAEAAWVALDTPRFEATVDRLAEAVPCLGETPDRALVARVHRLVGLDAFVTRDTVRARAAFAASRSIEPTDRLPSTFAPPGHPLQKVWADLPSRDVRTEVVAAPAEGTLAFDAAPGRARPTNVPTVFQWRDAAGSVRTTAYVWPEEPLPAYPVVKRTPRTPLLVAAAASGAVAAGLAVTTALAADRYWDDATPRDELDPLRATVNGAGGAAIGLGAVAGGLVVTALVVPWGG